METPMKNTVDVVDPRLSTRSKTSAREASSSWPTSSRTTCRNPWQIVIADNASTDKHRQSVADMLCERYSRRQHTCTSPRRDGAAP